MCDCSGLVHTIRNSVFWDVTLYIVVAVYQRGSKKIPAARTSEKLVSIYPMSLAVIPKDSSPVTACCYGRKAIPRRSHSNYNDSPSTVGSTVRDLTTVCLRFGIPSRLQPARWARNDSVVRPAVCSRDKPNWNSRTEQNFCSQFCARCPRFRLQKIMCVK
jgi:hypothetical protein